jgi:hypothetical protein
MDYVKSEIKSLHYVGERGAPYVNVIVERSAFFDIKAALTNGSGAKLVEVDQKPNGPSVRRLFEIRNL